MNKKNNIIALKLRAKFLFLFKMLFRIACLNYFFLFNYITQTNEYQSFTIAEADTGKFS